MKKTAFFLLILATFLMTFGVGQPWAGEVDVLINKLVEKGMLSISEAQELLTEMQKENDRQKADIKQVAVQAAKEEAKTTKVKLPKWVERIKLSARP